LKAFLKNTPGVIQSVCAELLMLLILGVGGAEFANRVVTLTPPAIFLLVCGLFWLAFFGTRALFVTSKPLRVLLAQISSTGLLYMLFGIVLIAQGWSTTIAETRLIVKGLPLVLAPFPTAFWFVFRDSSSVIHTHHVSVLYTPVRALGSLEPFEQGPLSLVWPLRCSASPSCSLFFVWTISSAVRLVLF
jgi:hypothetical protein